MICLASSIKKKFFVSCIQEQEQAFQLFFLFQNHLILQFLAQYLICYVQDVQDFDYNCICMQSPRKSKSLQPKQQHILVTYDPNLESLILPVQQRIFYLINESTETFKNLKHNSLLTKRAIKYLHTKKIVSGVQQLGLLQIRTYTYWLHYCDKTCNHEQLQSAYPGISIIYMGDNEDINSLFEKATKLMHLDFIWIGVGGRLGFSREDFQSNLKEFENFVPFEVNYLDQFLSELNKLVGKTQQFCIEEIVKKLDEIIIKLQPYQEQFQKEVEQCVCQLYNEPILISPLTYHNYFKVLKTRNYFKLIWIQQPVVKRYKAFLELIQSTNKLPMLAEWLNKDISNFLFLDDYIYQKFLQKISYEADFIVNRGITNQPYHQIINKNYKEIFRKFRPDFDEYFISICQILKIRSGCIKEAVGSIIVKNKRILATGYNGTPMGSINCYNGGCRVCNDSNKMNTTVLSCNCIHAEYSCIIEAGIQSTPNCILYTTQLPCIWCAKVICQAKISEVVYTKSQFAQLQYDHQQRVFDIFKLGGIKLKEFCWREKRFSRN